MKIIGKTDNGYLVEATETELAIAAGFNSSYDGSWPFRENRSIPSGTKIDVTAARDWHSRIRNDSHGAKKCVDLLRGLAEMIDGALPDVVIAPLATKAEESKNDDA